MHKRYGYGLSDLRKSIDKQHYKLEQSGNEEDWNGVTIDLSQKSSFALGMVAGLQISTESNGKCFYVTLDTIDFIETIKTDIEALK